MNLPAIRTVLAELKRVERAAKECLAECAAEDARSYITGSKKSAALRHASMDLTRALAEMRRPC